MWVGYGAGDFAGTHEDSQHFGDGLRNPFGPNDSVDNSVAVQIVRSLHAFWEFLVVDLFVHSRTQESHERSGFGHGEVSKRSPGGEHTSGCGVAQVHQERQTCFAMSVDGRGDLDHREERNCSFLHARPARGRARQNRKPFGRCALNRLHQAFGCRHTDRAGEEPEFTRDQGHAPAFHQAFAGDNGFVNPGLLACRLKVGCVVLGDSAGWNYGFFVPALERAWVYNDVEEFGN